VYGEDTLYAIIFLGHSVKIARKNLEEETGIVEWFTLHHGNASAHNVLSVWQFQAKKHVFASDCAPTHPILLCVTLSSFLSKNIHPKIHILIH
jgi:hypothetical protein